MFPLMPTVLSWDYHIPYDNSYSGLLVYLSPLGRRGVACDRPNWWPVTAAFFVPPPPPPQKKKKTT